jgi:hypothetical protein
MQTVVQNQPKTTEGARTPPQRPKQQDSTLAGQSVQAPIVNTPPMNDVVKVANVVQQMTELNGAVSEDKTVPITRIVLKLIRQNGW